MDGDEIEIYLVREAFFETLRCFSLNLFRNLGVADGVRNALTVFVLHGDRFGTDLLLLREWSDIVNKTHLKN